MATLGKMCSIPACTMMGEKSRHHCLSTTIRAVSFAPKRTSVVLHNNKEKKKRKE